MQFVPFWGMDTTICNRNTHMIAFRSIPASNRGRDLMRKFALDAEAFADRCPIMQTDQRVNSQGQHYTCMMGHHHQYTMVNLPLPGACKLFFEIGAFPDSLPRYDISLLMRPDGPAEAMMSLLLLLLATLLTSSAVLKNRSPGIAKHMEDNTKWHKGHSPCFGL